MEIAPDINRSIHYPYDRESFEQSGFGIFFIGQLDAIEPIYLDWSKPLIILDSGYMSQLLLNRQAEFNIGLSPAIGLDFENLPSMLKKSLDQADLIICKGMANYEAFSETDYKPIAYLLRTKCTAIANSMNLPLNKNAVKLYK